MKIPNNKKRVKKVRKETIPQYVKEETWRLYGGSLCWCCQHSPISAKNKHFGHIIAESNGGEVTIDNLRPICQNCNLRMGTMNMYDFMIKNSYPIRDIAIIERILKKNTINFLRLKNKNVFYIPTTNKGNYDCAIGVKSLFEKHPYLQQLDLTKLFTSSVVKKIHFHFVKSIKYCNYIKYQQQTVKMKLIEKELML